MKTKIFPRPVERKAENENPWLARLLAVLLAASIGGVFVVLVVGVWVMGSNADFKDLLACFVVGGITPLLVGLPTLLWK